ncbi:Tyrosinase ustQ [Colletotrichum tropicale]|nr:Tyrosinase ustQ [Colletotrichum tropicale]
MVKPNIIGTIALGMASAVSATCTDPAQRKSWSALTSAQKAEYIDSTLCLMDPERSPSISQYAGSKTIWEDLQVAHVAQVQFIHRVGAFLPWHRWYMTVHENLLREHCSYTGPLPYWDEQTDEAAGPLTSASIWGNDPATSFGTGASDSNGCLVDGPFTGVTYDLTADLERGATQCLSYKLNQAQFDLAAQDIVDACDALETYDDFNNCIGGSPHTSGHFAIGGTMDDVSLSPADPLFFMHHTNLDRIWYEWQTRNESRLTDMAGQNVATSTILTSSQPKSLPESAFVPYFGDNGGVTTLDHVMWMAGIVPNITIREVMDVKSEAICAEYV